MSAAHEVGQAVSAARGRLTGTVIAVHANVETLTSDGFVTEPIIVEVRWDDGDVTGERPQDLDR